MENHLYVIDTDMLEDRTLYDCWYRRMPEERKKKTDAFRFEKDRRLSLGAGILLQTGLLKEGVSDRELLYGRYGKPYLPAGKGVFFNLSHSGHYAVCAVSGHEVGTDIEEEKHFEENLIRYVFLESESAWIRRHAESQDSAFTSLWTFKESLMKYLGTGVSLEPKKICVDLENPDRTTAEGFSFDGLHFTKYEVPGCQLAVCSGDSFFSGKPEWISAEDLMSIRIHR